MGLCKDPARENYSISDGDAPRQPYSPKDEGLTGVIWKTATSILNTSPSKTFFFSNSTFLKNNSRIPHLAPNIFENKPLSHNTPTNVWNFWV